jgi:hypothetical protein
MSRTELAKYEQYRPQFNIIADKDDDTIDKKRTALYKIFNLVYKLLHTCLAHLLPFVVVEPNEKVHPNLTHVYMTRAWLLACALLPKQVFIAHARHQMYMYAYKSFRELAHNLLENFFCLGESLLAALVTPHAESLKILAGDTQLTIPAALQLIADAFPALTFAADLVTREKCLFPSARPFTNSIS